MTAPVAPELKYWPNKDPGEQLDYAFDWSPRNLGTDTIVVSTCEVVTGDVVHISTGVDPDNPAKTVTWLRGGTDGVNCTLLLKIETSRTPTRKLEQTVRIKIKNR